MSTAKSNKGHYQRLCGHIDVMPISNNLDLKCFLTRDDMAICEPQDRVTAGLQVLVNLVSEEGDKVKRVDRVLLDHYIARIDHVLGAQIDEILHHGQFQALESVWRGLKYTVDRVDFRANSRVELLDVDKGALGDDFGEVSETIQAGLYKHIYVQEYDTPGGEPITAVISNYEFDAGPQDVKLLIELSKVASAAHCPFIGSVGARFFQKENIDQVTRIEDLANYMERAEYIRWNSFRESDDARYIGLTLPRFQLRLPYGEHHPVRSFCYEENVVGEDARNYLWGSAAFAFAANMARCFKMHGWTVNVRGPESGGKVACLPLHQYDVGRGLQTKIPTETIIPETRELEYANLGFIPLSYYKNSDYACFFSANSVQRPAIYATKAATANSRINARLPYIFLSARLAHYLKVIQRENIGSSKNRLELESELNDWLETLITRMNAPGPELAATHPLRDGRVVVENIDDNPGFYKVSLHAVPHFQIEGIDVQLSMVGKLPRGGAGP